MKLNNKQNNVETVLLVVGDGGFAWESYQLTQKLDEQGVKVIIAYPEESYEFRDYFTQKNVTFYNALTHRNGFDFKFLKSWLATFYIASKTKLPNNVMAIGCSGAIPFFIIAKIKRRKTFFIETITRTNTLSKMGRLLKMLRLADFLLVQWPEMEDKDNGILFKGNIL